MAYTSFIDVHLIAIREDRVLLARRAGTGYADGLWNLPSGKLECDEDVEAAIIREAREEIGIQLSRGDTRMAAALHYRTPDEHARVGFFFHAEQWIGEPFNAEPHKCSELRWFRREDIPADTVPYTIAGLELFWSGVPFGLAGWPAQAQPSSWENRRWLPHGSAKPQSRMP